LLSSYFVSPVDYEKIGKLTSDSGLDDADVKACLAALVYIIGNSAKYDVTGV
jgi:hypothetical protein